MEVEEDEMDHDEYQKVLTQIETIENVLATPGLPEAALAPWKRTLAELEAKRKIAASANGIKRRKAADRKRREAEPADAEDRQPSGQVAENVRRSMQARDERQRAREARNRQAESSAAAAPAGGRQAAGQIVMGRAPPSRASGPRAPALGANPLQLGGLVEKKLTKEMFEERRSELPVWALANDGVDPQHHFARPSEKEFPALHKSVDGNISGHWRKDKDYQQVAAIIAMELATRQPRLAMKFGQVQIPVEEGGGPFYTAARAHTPHPNDWGMHAETHLKGLTQSSKSPEQGHLAWFETFILGRFAVNFIRNKGGSTSGTSDMRSAVKGASDEVMWTWDRIKHRYPHLQGVDITQLALTPVCTSRGAVPAFQHNTTGSYKLHGHQAMVACCNKAQLQPFNESVSEGNKAGSKRARLADQPPMHYFGIFSGCRLADDKEGYNPYLPYIEDPSLLGSEDPRGRLLPAIAALFDEDDVNKGGSGSDVVRSKMLFEQVSGAHQLAKLLQLSQRDSDHLDDDLLSDSGVSECEKRRARQERDDSEEFFGEFTGMRALFAAVYAFSATPTTGVYDLGSDEMSCNEIAVRMIEIKPPPGYIGFGTEHHLRTNPHCKRHVDVVQMPDPVATHKANLTEAYKRLMLEAGGVDVDEDGYDALPAPFTSAATRGGGRCIRAPPKGKRDVLVFPGWTAGDLYRRAKQLVKHSGIKRKGFWFADGSNVRHILEDMEVNRDAYPQGYRNVLITTNYTRQGNMLKNWVHTVLGFSGTEMREGMRCPNGDLTKDLICVEWFHKYVRFNWVFGEVDEPLFRQAINSLKLESDDVKCSHLYSEGCAFADEMVWCDRSGVDGGDSDAAAQRGVSCATPRSNINFAYSVMHKYKELLTAKHAEDGQPTFLKMMVFAGEIGGRGCNYKTAGTHRFVLTDQFFKFDVKSDGQMTMHAAAAIQIAGRCNTCVADPESAPPIKLWICRSSWAYLRMWHAAMNELPRYHQLKRLDESYGDLMERIVRDHGGLGCPNLRRMFGSPQAEGKGGKLCWHYLDHQKAKGKQVAEQTHRSAVANDCVPETMLETGELVDNTEADQAAHIDAVMAVVLARSSDPDAVDDEDEDEGMDQGLEAALGAPSIEGIVSVPQPEPRNFLPPPRLSKGRRGGGGGSSGKNGYVWMPSDNEYWFDAVTDMQELHAQGFPKDKDGATQFAWLLEMWSSWYIYFLTMPMAALGIPKPSLVERSDYGHGIHTASARINYVRSVMSIRSATGRAFFKSFDDLPQSSDDESRIKEKYKLFKARIDPRLNADPRKLQTEAKNFYSHMAKWIDLFPPSMNLTSWLVNTPAPSRAAPRKWLHEPEPSASSAAGPSAAGPAGAGPSEPGPSGVDSSQEAYMFDDSDDDDRAQVQRFVAGELAPAMAMEAPLAYAAQQAEDAAAARKRPRAAA